MICKEARLPQTYDNYVFDLYGTLVDIRTREDDPVLWKKLALFYGYYDAAYDPDELQEAYGALVAGKERALKNRLEENPRYSHEASPEIEITDVFLELYTAKGAAADRQLAIHTGQFFRVLSTDYVRLYPGTETMLSNLKEHGKKIYLLSNAQRIFTEYEMHVLGLVPYFDGILISSDHKTKKPDKRFFDLLLTQYRLDVKKSLFIGNDSTTDIAGARKIGMDTYYVESNISPAQDRADADYVVSHFTYWK
jgi:putative hydrolase of the HAD superfamily